MLEKKCEKRLSVSEVLSREGGVAPNAVRWSHAANQGGRVLDPTFGKDG